MMWGPEKTESPDTERVESSDTERLKSHDTELFSDAGQDFNASGPTYVNLRFTLGYLVFFICCIEVAYAQVGSAPAKLSLDPQNAANGVTEIMPRYLEPCYMLLITRFIHLVLPGSFLFTLVDKKFAQKHPRAAHFALFPLMMSTASAVLCLVTLFSLPVYALSRGSYLLQRVYMYVIADWAYLFIVLDVIAYVWVGVLHAKYVCADEEMTALFLEQEEFKGVLYIAVRVFLALVGVPLAAVLAPIRILSVPIKLFLGSRPTTLCPMKQATNAIEWSFKTFPLKVLDSCQDPHYETSKC